MADAVDAFLAQYYARHPVNATFTGIHMYDSVLPDWTVKGRMVDADERRNLRQQLVKQKSLDAELAIANLDVRDVEHDSGYFIARNPSLWTGEAIFGAVSLMLRPFAPRNDRLMPLAARLDAIAPFLLSMRSSVADRMPSRWIARAQRECTTANRLFSVGLEKWLAEEPIDPELSARVRRAGDRARAAFDRCYSWLVAAQHASTPDTGCGDRVFDVLLKRGHFCMRSSGDLLREAQTVLAYEKAKLADIASQSGDDPIPDPYFAAFTSKWDACRAFCAKHDLVEWPDWPLKYVEFPEWCRDVARELYWLFYRSPSPFDPYRVHEYLVQLGWTSSAVTLNHVVHHGALGHHVQNWHAATQIKSRIGVISAIDCANRIGMFLGGSMAEGWACYATELMDEMEFLTPRERVAQQQSRVRMIARAIVDIRMHTQGMGVHDAIKFYATEVGMNEGAADAEVAKNSMFPCTALMYWLGTQGILDLRKTMQTRLRDGFTMRRFHDDLLSYGSIPVHLVSRLMTGPAQ